MRSTRFMLAGFSAFAGTLAVASCGGSGGSASPVGLAYGVPVSPSVVYATADTVRVNIDAMGQSITMAQGSAATYAAEFSRSGDGVSVSLTAQDYMGHLSQPMGPTTRIEEDEIGGPLVLELTRRGDVTIASRPELESAAAQVFQVLSTSHSFFPALPGRAVEEGESWVDTVSYEGPEGPGDISVESILTYTAMGDTVVDGRTLVKLDMFGTFEQEAAGSVQGTDFFQSTFAGAAGHTLWDMSAGLMFEQVLTLEGDGSVEASVMPGAFPLTFQASKWVRLQP